MKIKTFFFCFIKKKEKKITLFVTTVLTIPVALTKTGGKRKKTKEKQHEASYITNWKIKGS